MMPVVILASSRFGPLGGDRPAAVAERPAADSARLIMPNSHLCPKEPGADLTGRRCLS
jgi:hypothetical protein